MTPLRFDAELDEARRRRLLWAMPAGLYVLGTAGGPGGPYHAMTISLVTQAATEPCVLAAAVESTSRTHALLAASGLAALSVLHRDQRELVRRFVKPDLDVAATADGLQIAGVAMVRSPGGLPVLAEALGAVELGVVGRHDFASHTLFLLEVRAVAVSEGVLAGPASAHAAPVLRMEDTRLNYGG